MIRFVRSAGLWAAVLASLLLGRPVVADQPVTVRLGYSPSSITYTPFYIADRLGFFRAEGLNVDFIPFQSAAQMVAPLGAGQLDAGGGAISAALYNAVSRGIDVRIVADMGSDPPGNGFQALVVRNTLIQTGQYKSYKDLKGRTIAIPGRGTSTTALVAALLKKANLTVNDVNLVYLDGGDALSGMRNGSVDAAFLPEPGPTVAKKDNIATTIIRSDAFYPNQQITVLLYGANLMNSRDTGVRFMRAYLKAVRVYNDNLRRGVLSGPQADQIAAFFADRTHQDKNVLKTIIANGDNPNGRLNLDSMRDDFDYFKSQGLIESKSMAVENAVDESFVAEAIKQLGPYRR